MPRYVKGMRVIIFHGWGANSDSNWFPWLKAELEKKDIDVVVPDMPSSENPKLRGWMNAAEKLKIGQDDILVGHSLGTVLILRLLEKYKVKSAYLVSSFHVYLDIPEIKDFTEHGFDFEKIKNNKITMLSSDNDPFIYYGIAEDLSKILNSKLIKFHNMEHLSRGTDNFKFPELLTLINEDI